MREHRWMRERGTLRRNGSEDRQSGTQTKCQKGSEIKIERPNRGKRKKKEKR